MSNPEIDPSTLPVLTPEEFLDHISAQSQRGAKACDAMLEDVLPTGQAMRKAIKPWSQTFEFILEDLE
jgi:hypothetical protein